MEFIKKNKKLCIIISIVLILIITIMIVNDNKQTKENINKIFSVVGEKNYYDVDYNDDISKYELEILVEKNYSKPYFKEIAKEKFNGYIKNDEYINAMNIIVLLDKYNVVDDDINKTFVDMIKKIKFDSLEENKLAEFIADYSSLKNYSTNELNNVVLNLIKDNCPNLIMEDEKGGYYDSMKDKYVSKSERVDPLGRNDSSYSVGTYTSSVSYGFYGDILVRRYTKRWYGTSSYDSNNSDSTSYYFKGESLISSVKTGGYSSDSILSILANAENYVLGKYIINIKDNYINVLGCNVLSYKGSLDVKEY